MDKDIKNKISELLRTDNVQDEEPHSLVEALQLLLFIESRGELPELLHKMRQQAQHPRAKLTATRTIKY